MGVIVKRLWCFKNVASELQFPMDMHVCMDVPQPISQETEVALNALASCVIPAGRRISRFKMPLMVLALMAFLEAPFAVMNNALAEQ